MKKEDKIAVYYIATNDYKNLFPEFLKSIKNFYPKNQKIIKVISDGLEEYKNYTENNIKVEVCPRINNYPWPIIALYKMWHIEENKDDNCEYACYFNANAEIHPTKEEYFNEKKLNVSYHSFNSKNRRYDPWPHIHINPYSQAYLENNTYEYLQSGFFFGPSKLVYEMCHNINEMIKEDTKRCLFAQWHDESYFNKWCVESQDKVMKDYRMTVYKEEIDDKRFIYLRDKKDYSIDKKAM